MFDAWLASKSAEIERGVEALAKMDLTVRVEGRLCGRCTTALRLC